MKIFPPTQTVMKFLGYLYTYSDQTWYRMLNYFVYALSASLIVPTGMFVISNVSDLPIVVEILSLCSGGVNANVKGLIYIFNRERVKVLLIDLQRNVDRKEQLRRTKHYMAMNKEAKFWSLIDIAIMTNSICSICLGPILIVLYHKVIGDLTNEMYRQPLAHRLPFDIYRSPGYEFTYVFCILPIICIGYTIAMTDCMFMGVCSQIIASQKDLQDMLCELVTGDRSGSVVDWRLKKCIQFHNQIIEQIKSLSHVSSPIIFAQFILSVMQMGTLAFQMQEGQNIAIDRHVANIVTSIVALSELFIYCYYGNEVTFQGVAIADAAYNSLWYKCSPKQRCQIYMIMLRAQCEDTFKGLNIFKCSLGNFMTVLNMVASALTLLQSVV